jgi:hypothetical protein
MQSGDALAEGFAMLPQRERIRKQFKHFLNWLAGPAERTTAVFVFGDQRSGTNMLKECFTRTRSTDVYNESDEDAFDDFMLRPLDTLDRLIDSSHASHVIFKSLADSARARELLAHFADSRAIWIYRNYKDVVNSAVRTTHWRSPLENLRITLEEPERARWRRMNLSSEQLDLLRRHYDRGLSDNSARALFWYVRNDLLFSQDLADDPRITLISYESLIAHPDEELHRAWAHVGLTLEPEYHAHFSPRSIGRHPEPEIDEEIDRLAQSMMERLEAARARSARTGPADGATTKTRVTGNRPKPKTTEFRVADQP